MPALLSRCGGGGGIVGKETVAGAVNPPGRAANLLGTCQWSHASGDVLMDYIGTTRPFVINAGVYSFVAQMTVHATTLPVSTLWLTDIDIAPLTGHEVDVRTMTTADGVTAAWRVTVASPQVALDANDQVLPQFMHGWAGHTLEADGTLWVTRWS